METSCHYYTDRYGYRCAVEIISEDDDIVVFECVPGLTFDFEKYGLRIKRSTYYDYTLKYVLKHGRMFFREFCAHLSIFSKKKMINGVKAEVYGDGKWSIYRFGDIPVEYSGILSIGKDFDMKYWRHEDKKEPVPFSPHVYKENGYIKIENGVITEKILSKEP